MDQIKLILGDCLEEMQQIPDNSIDMILCDLPYGTTACKWDAVIPFNLLWQQYNRIIKMGCAIVLTSTQPFTSALVMSNPEWFKYSWFWKKSKASNFLHAPNMPLKIIEEILIFSNGSVGHACQLGDRRCAYNPQGIRQGTTFVKQNKNTSDLKIHRDSRAEYSTGYTCKSEGYPTTLLEFKSETGIHPTQKPVSLFEYLINTYSNIGDTVLDNCMGSGTTGIACLNTKRNFIGIEKDEKYFSLCESRIYNHTIPLFII